jgi:hypothetical protein
MLGDGGSDKDVWAGLLLRFPVVGEEVVEVVHGLGAERVENVVEVSEKVNVKALAGRDGVGEVGRISPSMSPPKKTRQPRRER